MKRYFHQHLRATVGILFAVCIWLSGGMDVHAARTVMYNNDRISITADNEPLMAVLEDIAKEANILVFISREFTPGYLSIQIKELPLENALDRVLRGLNVAKIYHEHDGEPRLTAIRIYPKGKYTGPLDVVVQASIPEPDVPFGGQGRKYASDRTDVMQPQEYVHTVEYDALVSAAVALEKREQDTWQDIQALKDQVNDEVDETKNQVLSLALLERYEAFEQMQKNHIDTLEKMHRIEHFMESRAKKNRQNNEGL
jgi:hypothetical protein